MQVKIKMERESNAQAFKVSVGSEVLLDIEDYVVGVVASEVGNAPLQAAAAQAICARTIAYRAYTKDTFVSDLSTKAQAFRVERMNSPTYPVAIEAAKLTKGMVLFYNGKVIETCAYSANNGGQTVSSEERWGGVRPYLIAQKDPWDGSAKRTGHGVGMSQLGAKNAANQGVNYKTILSFYYPGTTIQEVSDMSVENDKVLKVRKWAESMVGTGYIYGATGWVCSKARREQQAKQYPEYANTIMTTGAKWDGKICHDCAQFTRKAMAEVGITLPSGATSQWKANIWESKGTKADIDKEKMCLLFRESNGVMQHVLLYCGNGYVIDARGTANGVIKTKLGDYNYTHWAIPKGLYSGSGSSSGSSNNSTNTTPSTSTPTTSHSTLRKGDKTAEVKDLQNALLQLGYSLPKYGADGSYGDETIAAVKQFQTDNKLSVDGICGPKTWEALDSAMALAAQKMTGIVTAKSGSTVNLRKEKSTNSTILYRVPLKTEVPILEYGKDWCKTEYKGYTGYMMTEFLEVAYG